MTGPLPFANSRHSLEAITLKRFDVGVLLAAYRREANGTRGSLVALDGLGGKDGYNPSAAFLDEGRLSTYVRVETRTDEFLPGQPFFIKKESRTGASMTGCPCFVFRMPAWHVFMTTL